MGAIVRPQLAVGQLLNKQHPIAKSMKSCWVAGAGPRGKVWHDLTDGRNHSPLVNGPAWSSQTHEGGFGSLDLNGSSQYSNAGNSPAFAITDAITITAWVRWRGSISGGGFAVLGNGNNKGFVLRVFNTSTWVFTLAGVVGVSGSVATAADEWFHLGITYDRANIKFFKNGVLKDTVAQTNAIIAATGDMYLGAWNDSDTGSSPRNYWDGQLASINISNRAFAPSGVRDHFDETRQGYPDLFNSGRRSVYAAAVAPAVGQPTMRRWGGIPHMTPGPALAGRSW